MFSFFDSANINETEAAFLVFKPHTSVPVTETEVSLAGYDISRWGGDGWMVEQTGDCARGDNVKLPVPDGEFDICLNKEKDVYEIEFTPFFK